MTFESTPALASACVDAKFNGNESSNSPGFRRFLSVEMSDERAATDGDDQKKFPIVNSKSYGCS